MVDITEDVGRYREAARHLWNSSFRVGSADWDARDRFGVVARALFDGLVLLPHGIGDAHLPAMSEPRPGHFARIAVVPASGDVPIMINRGSGASGYWDDPVSRFAAESMSLRLVDFFDWDELGMRELRFVRAQIVDSAAHPHLVGRYALLDCEHVRLQLLGMNGRGDR
jgi:hypothetical protein